MSVTDATDPTAPATQPAVPRGVPKRLGSRWLHILKALFGLPSQRRLARAVLQIDRIRHGEAELARLSDAELHGRGLHLRGRARGGVALDRLLPEAFGAVCLAAHRVIGLRPFDVQLAAGVVLHEGGLAELATGEGKTLVAVLPVFLNALTGKGVHVTTVNDYLARRDAEWNEPIYRALSLTVGVLQGRMEDHDRIEAYRCDITYGTAAEFGFDFLRDRLRLRRRERSKPRLLAPWTGNGLSLRPPVFQVQRGHNFALVDEADNIFIDEARTPLVIGSTNQPARPEEQLVYRWADRVARAMDRERDFLFDPKKHKIELTAQGRQRIRWSEPPASSGKVVGVVVAGVKGSGVNFAIPVSHVSGFLARPELDAILPRINRSNLHKPATFQARCWTVPPPAKPLDFELILAIDKGPERTLALARGERMHRVTVVPITMPEGPLPLRVVLEFADRTVTGTLQDRTVKVNGKDLQLSDLRRISRQPKPIILLGDGRSLEGTVGGLEQVEIQVGKEQLKVDVTKARSALFEINTPAKALSWVIIARQDGKEIARNNGVLPLDDDPETRLVGSWEGPTSVGNLRDVWTIARDNGVWSVRGKYYDGDKETGACHGTEVKFSGDVLSFVHQYDKPPVPTWTSGAEVAMKLNGDQLEYTWKNGKLAGKVFLNRAKE